MTLPELDVANGDVQAKLDLIGPLYDDLPMYQALQALNKGNLTFSDQQCLENCGYNKAFLNAHLGELFEKTFGNLLLRKDFNDFGNESLDLRRGLAINESEGCKRNKEQSRVLSIQKSPKHFVCIFNDDNFQLKLHHKITDSPSILLFFHIVDFLSSLLSLHFRKPTCAIGDNPSNYIFIEEAIMYQLIKNTELIEQASQQFLDPHPCFYSFPREIFPLVSAHGGLNMEELEVGTKVRVAGKDVSNRINLHVLANKKNKENCILYLHGLSSYCLEGKFLIPYLASSFSLCLFDSRSHGLNQAPLVTYGLLEAQELVEIIRALVKRGFGKIVLWGRSMGAVSCLRAVQEFRGEQVMQSVRYVVADSPFGSFRMIATEQISKMVSLPDFLAGMLASAFTSKIQEKHGIDLNQISLEKFNSKVPVSFFYSSKDEMMGMQHIQTVTQNYTGTKDLCDIKVMHNEERPAWVVLRAMGRIHAALRDSRPTIDDSKKKGLSVAKIGSQKFLSVVTPSNLDSGIRNSMRIIPLYNVTKPIRNSQYRAHAKENSMIERPFKPPMPTLTKQSCILQDHSPVSSFIKLGTPSSKTRKGASNSYL